MNNLFKSIDNTTLLTYISLVLSIAIFLSILFGCMYKKPLENFETEKEDVKDKDVKDKDVKDKDVKDKDVKDKSSDYLTDKEKSLLEGLKNGSIDEKKLETFISEKTIDKETVEKLIEYIQDKFIKN